MNTYLGLRPFVATLAWLVYLLGLVVLLVTVLLGCAKPLVSQRPQVNAPVVAGDTKNGKQVYKLECSQCHSIQPGLNDKGPQLDRIYLSKAAALADYQSRYSNALKTSQWTWNKDTLDQYIKNPHVALPKGKMLYDGLQSKTDREDVIAYLSTLRMPNIKK